MAKILIIDDEESIKYTFKFFLSCEGHDAMAVGSYDDAMTAILDDI